MTPSLPKKGVMRVSGAVVSQPPFLSGELEDYAGKWVAIRDGHVVASADSLEELREDVEVRREDAVFIVPDRDALFY